MRILYQYINNITKSNLAYLFHKRRKYQYAHSPWKILFFGSDDFSVSSLKYLNNEFKVGKLIHNLEVVTSIKEKKSNAIYNYARNANLTIHKWPIKLSNGTFDIGVVVSFGHLIPNELINKFPLGIINVHASLLPKWRGAAPIIHTIANGDTETGVTIMKIQPFHFDVGEIVMQRSIQLNDNIKMPDLYKQLAETGASLLKSCIEEMPECLDRAEQQPSAGVSYAPKVTSEMAQVRWNELSARQVYALARALDSLYPLSTNWNSIPLKLYNITPTEEECSASISPGSVKYNKTTKTISIQCADGQWISCSKIGLPAKKPMSANDFNNGYFKKESVEKRIFK